MPVKIQSTSDILFDKIDTLYDSESKLAGILDTITQAVTNAQIRQVLNELKTSTQQRVTYLSNIATTMGLSVEGGTTAAMDGMANEVNSFIAKRDAGANIDLGLLSQVQTLVSYLLYAYSYSGNIASALKLDTEVVNKLSSGFHELEETNSKISALAKNLFGQIVPLIQATEQTQASGNIQPPFQSQTQEQSGIDVNADTQQQARQQEVQQLKQQVSQQQKALEDLERSSNDAGNVGQTKQTQQPQSLKQKIVSKITG